MAKKNDPTLPPEEPGAFRDSGDLPVDDIVQQIVAREQVEPEEGFEPPPWWVWAASVLLLFIMGFYLGRYGGSWSTVAHEVENPMEASATPVKRVVDGSIVFIGVCQTCHQADGNGVAGQYPPLAGSEWLVQDPETPARIVLYGLEGPITVKGKNFNNKMPHFFDKLSDDEIAAVLTHVRSSWGNNAGPVEESTVESLRKELGTRAPWSSAELASLRGKK